MKYVKQCLNAILFVTSGHTLDMFAETPPDTIERFLSQRNKIVLTFVGYSDSGYEDVEKMLDEARSVLSAHTPNKTIVNIGATPSGIGKVYEIAKKMGFETTGIVSTQARKYKVPVSPHVDKVFYVNDESWGGFLENTDVLSPTSEAMVRFSDIIVGIGGGAVSRDEMIAVRRRGKTVKYIPADMNHAMAIDEAREGPADEGPADTQLKEVICGV